MIMSPNCINKGQLRERLEQVVTNELPGIWLDGSRRNIMRLANSLCDSCCWLRGPTVVGLGQLMTGDRHRRVNDLASPLWLHGPSVERFMRHLQPFASTPLLKPLMHMTVLVLHLNSSVCHFQIFFWLILFFISQSYILHRSHLISLPFLWNTSATYLMFLCCSLELLNTVPKLIFVFSVVIISKWTHNNCNVPHSNSFETVT